MGSALQDKAVVVVGRESGIARAVTLPGVTLKVDGGEPLI
jgi:hypothetical protein